MPRFYPPADAAEFSAAGTIHPFNTLTLTLAAEILAGGMPVSVVPETLIFQLRNAQTLDPFNTLTLTLTARVPAVDTPVSVSLATLETTQGQIDGFFSQLNRWFLWSTPMQMPPPGGCICGRLTGQRDPHLDRWSPSGRDAGLGNPTT